MTVAKGASLTALDVPARTCMTRGYTRGVRGMIYILVVVHGVGLYPPQATRATVALNNKQGTTALLVLVASFLLPAVELCVAFYSCEANFKFAGILLVLFSRVVWSILVFCRF